MTATQPSRRGSGLVDADVVERVRQLELFSRFRVEGLLNGQNVSPFKGFTADFLQHRPYQPGDPIKHLDWRVFGKTERLYTREYEELTNVQVSLVLDVSNSMAFGEGALTKHAFSVRCAALLAYLSFLGHDSVSLTFFSETRTARLGFGSGKRHMQRLFAMLEESTPSGGTDFPAGLRSATALTVRKGLTVVFSDCMDDSERIAKTLARLRLEGSDVIVFQVFTPAERDFPFNVLTRFHDMEGADVLAVDAPLMRREYRELFARHEAEMHEACLRRGFDHAALAVEDEYDVPILAYVRRRMALLT